MATTAHLFSLPPPSSQNLVSSIPNANSRSWPCFPPRPPPIHSQRVSSSSSSTSSAPLADVGSSQEPGNDQLPPSSCKACGKEEMERGCNGEGRIQGGIATVPGFGWWPIKAYRPCPGFVASGGRYRRKGQSMDDVASGGGGRGASAGIDDGVQTRKKKTSQRKS